MAEEAMMYPNYRRSCVAGSMTVILSIVLALGMNPSPASATVTFTSSPGGGSTQFSGSVVFSVGDTDGDFFSSDLLDFPSGTSGNSVVSTMNGELPFAFPGNVAGNVLTIANATSGAYMASAVIGMSMQVTGGGGSGVNVPNFPLVMNPPILPPYVDGAFQIISAGRDGQPAPVKAAGDLRVSIGFGTSPPVHIDIPLTPSMWTYDLLPLIDQELRQVRWPSGVEYFGLINGMPTFGTGPIADVLYSAAGANTSGDPGFLIGGAQLPAVQAIRGDANLDGKVDFDDYGLIDRGHAGGANGWLNGDFNNDGMVDAADYLLIDQAFALGGGGLSAELLAKRQDEFGEAYVAQLLASIPEPSGTLLAIIAMGTVLAGRSGRVLFSE